MTTAATLTSRDLAVLRDVRDGRAELVCGQLPDVLIDGCWCADQTAAHALCAAGLIAPAVPAAPGTRVRGVLTCAGLAALGDSRHAGQLPQTARPGGTSLASLRRVGSPNTHHVSGEDSMLRTTNPDCLALGCDWDWGTEPCGCGRPHTFRICARCLFSDDPVCDADELDSGGGRVNACAEGCYKHYVQGLGWVCCKCGGYRCTDPDRTAIVPGLAVA